jgi:beta-phosphoglucomutase-like phosphatase (HAD superfamily)
MTTELVIFECDGLLIDSEVISARMLIAGLKGYGVDMDMTLPRRMQITWWPRRITSTAETG